MEELTMLLDAVRPHLEELRRRLFRCVAAFVLALVAGMFAAGPILAFLRENGPAAHLALHAFSPWEGIQVYMQVATVAAMVFVGPYCGIQLWLFAAPGLRTEERRAALRYIPLSTLLLAAGILFGYFVVFRMAFLFTAGVSDSIQVKTLYSIQAYFSFMVHIVVPMGLLFLMPAVVMFLTRLGLLTPQRLSRVRRYAYMTLIVLGVCITPPDFISDFLLIVPLLSLYEVSILCCGLTYRKIRLRQPLTPD